MPSTAARSCCVDANKRSHALPMPFRDPGASAQMFNEQLPASGDVTSVDGAPAPILRRQSRRSVPRFEAIFSARSQNFRLRGFLLVRPLNAPM